MLVSKLNSSASLNIPLLCMETSKNLGFIERYKNSESDNITQINIHSSKFGAKYKVEKKVIIATIQSCFSILKACLIGSILIRFITAIMITAASVACGK